MHHATTKKYSKISLIARSSTVNLSLVSYNVSLLFSSEVHPIQGPGAPRGRGLQIKSHSLYGYMVEVNG